MAETTLKPPRKTPTAQKTSNVVSDAKTGTRKKATATVSNTEAAKSKSVASAAKGSSKSKISPEKSGTPRKAPAPKTARPAAISDEQRYRMIAEAAYYRAESRQFKSDPLRDWIEAEKDIASLLSEGS